MITIKRSRDQVAIREIFDALWGPEEEFPGFDDAWWLVRDAGKVVGFCSARYLADERIVFISSAGLAPSARGHGLQRRMIETRIRWAESKNARQVLTYTMLKNYPSMINLLRCGFKFYDPPYPWAGGDVHYYALVF